AMLESMKPPRARYAGTLCHDCAEFDLCHERGRCYYAAFMTSGTLFGPQGNCPYINGGIASTGC
ncbi:MAG TPA: hypothetical protein VNN08_03285, partial [Thermoanaerobaculia bacterium]|nr:hypothetical protein [Thermoanaerobaculia bacterium]